jgi:acyl-CoA thioester hydrolase
MGGFRFYHPIEVRYGDLDPQGHLNNARYLTYFEQARISYVANLGVWRPGDFMNIGIILADAHVTFRAAVVFGQKIVVGVRVARLGNKSMDMEYQMEDADTGQAAAVGSTVLVAYEYATRRTIPIPDNWRSAITAFEQPETA